MSKLRYLGGQTYRHKDSSVLSKTDEARCFTTVVLHCSLQTNNPNNHSVFTCTALWASTPTNMCIERSVTRCGSINKFSGSRWTRTLHQGSNIAYFSVVNFENFLVYIYKEQPIKFAKMMTLYRA